MALITGHRLGKSYGADDIFSEVSVSIPHASRIALVGPNGGGKTTLLRLLAKEDEPTEGTVTHAKNLTVGFLPQRAEEALDSQLTVWEEMLRVFADLLAQETALADLAAKLGESPEDEALLTRYGDDQRRFEDAGGFEYHDWITKVLRGLGFDLTDFSRPVTQLSGGQKTRVLLARLLLEKPALLILDEPTNHLDIKAIEWLEGWLNDYQGALLLVSHDRYFMDKVVTHVWELVFGRLEEYRGNYSHYIRQREERHQNRSKQYARQQEFIAKETDFIRRNLAGQNTRQAQGRRKRLERYLAQEAVFRPKEQKSIHVRFEESHRSGNQVVITQDLVLGYQDDAIPLFKAPDIVLRRGECAALIGPNGTGKTTFIKTILGEIQPLSGIAKLGANVEVGYFAQAHERLDPDKTIIDEILDQKPMLISEARNYLGTYLFSGDDVFKKISQLSGGERGRVAMAKLSLSGANLLLLDEPTNHLDIASQEILEAVLDDFEGTIILVSHDRYLIKNLATQIWSLQSVVHGELEESEMIVYDGPYEEYLDFMSGMKERTERKKESPAPVTSHQVRSAKPALSRREHERLVAAVEAEINLLEIEMVDLTGALQTASQSGEVLKVKNLGEAYQAAEEKLTILLDRWEDLLSEE